jgi:hypothetical protein
MRRIALLAVMFLFLASCGYRAVLVDGPPIIQGGIGTAPPRIAQIRGHGHSLRLCREVGRARCDVQTCKGRGMDLVTLRCGAGMVSRCEIGRGGC